MEVCNLDGSKLPLEDMKLVNLALLESDVAKAFPKAEVWVTSSLDVLGQLVADYC